MAIPCYDMRRFDRFDNVETGYYRYILTQTGVEIIYPSEKLSGDDSDDLTPSKGKGRPAES